MKKLALLIALIRPLTAQVFPGYLDTVIIPRAPANPSSTCLAGSACARIYALGTSSAANMNCILPSGGACGYFGAAFLAGGFQISPRVGATQQIQLFPTVANTVMNFEVFPSGTAAAASLRMSNGSDLTMTNNGVLLLQANNLTANIRTQVNGTGPGMTVMNIGEDGTGSALTAINFQFNGVTKHTWSATKFTTPAIELTGLTSAASLATDSSGNIIAGSPIGTVLGKYTTTFSSATSVTVTHNLGTSNVQVAVYDGSGNQLIPQGLVITSANVVTLTFGAAQTGSVVVSGYVVPTYSATFASATSFTLTHNLGSTYLLVSVYDGSGNQLIPSSQVSSLNSVAITFPVAQSGSISVAGVGGVSKYQTGFTSSTSVTVTHNLGSSAVLVSVFDGSGNPVIPQSVVVTSANMVTLTFGAAQTGVVLVIG